jgi:hypothetical protein
MRRGVLLAALVAGALLLTGCNGDPTPVAATASTSPTSASTSEVPTPTETPTPTPTFVPGISYTIECDDGNSFTDYHDAWSGNYDFCDSEGMGEPSALELKAVKTAYGKSDVDDIASLYSLCASTGGSQWNYLKHADVDQVKEIKGMFMLCPHHPERKKIAALMGNAYKDINLEATGRLFYDGTYRVSSTVKVGKNIKPGTYVVHNVEGCYWERTNSHGNTIDNGFILSAPRVVVTIRSSDYAFTAKDCGSWRPV